MSSFAAPSSQQSWPSTRLAKPSHEPWNPHGYQRRGVEFLKERGAAGLLFDPGMGKTSVVLEAFRQLKEEGIARRMLIVAPLRVCQLVWRQEGQKWSQFRDLTFSLIHGPKKEEALKQRADIHLINPEGIQWLASQFYRRQELPWDTVVIDELTKFKHHKAKRSKLLRKKLQGVRRRWGLTGSLAPNGYMDLFGQMLMLDDGAALGDAITYYRDRYFVQGYNGFEWGIRGGAAKQIEARIAPYMLRMAAKDYLELPDLIDNIIPLELSPAARKTYRAMKNDMIASLPEGVVTAANAGVVNGKLRQMANGAIYVRPGEYAEIHTVKLDALEDLIEELQGQPLFVGYEFQSDLDRILDRLGRDTPTLSGLSGKRAAEVESAWNRGQIPVLLAHPQSAGHGLNLQGSSAAHVCWFCRPWDLDLYEQFIDRIVRQGNKAKRVFNHILVVRGTMDEDVGKALDAKDTTQQRLLTALAEHFSQDDEPAPIATGRVARTEEDDMVKKLGMQTANPQPVAAAPEPAAQTAAPAQTARAMPATGGWGSSPSIADDMPPTGQPEPIMQEVVPGAAKGGWGKPAATPAVDPQRAAIREKITAPAPEALADTGDAGEVPAAVRALAAFPAGIVQQLSGQDTDPETGAAEPTDGDRTPNAPVPAEETKPRTRKPRTPPETTVSIAATGTTGAAQEMYAGTALAGYRPVDTAGEFYPKGEMNISYNGLPASALILFFEGLAAALRADT